MQIMAAKGRECVTGCVGRSSRGESVVGNESREEEAERKEG